MARRVRPWQRGPLAARRLADGERTTAISHLEELRWRIAWSVTAVVATFIAAYAGAGTLLNLLNRPLGDSFAIVTLGVTEPFMTVVTVAGYCALAAAFPILLFNTWQYLAPALTATQRRAARPYLLAAPLLFATGVVFGYLFVLGPSVHFLLGMGTGHFTVQVRAQDYYSFTSTLLIAMGLVFLFPVALLTLERIGVVTVEQLRRHRRIALLLAIVLAALLPTADPVSLLLETAPLVALYELSILMVSVQSRRRRRAAATGSD